MKRNNITLWIFLAITVGAMTWFGVQFVGTGLVKKEALPLAALITAFIIGLRWVRIPAPVDSASQRSAVLSQSAKSGLALIFSALTIWAIFVAAQQGMRGYPALDPAGITAGQEPDLDFYSVTGVPMTSAIYEMKGSEGQHLLVPFDRFEGRVIVMLDHRPPENPLTATGRIRTDVRTVQRSREGKIDGPFLRLYREHLGLTQETKVYFLDTGQRAGLNVRAIACILAPLYLLLLAISAPVRRLRPSVRPKQR